MARNTIIDVARVAGVSFKTVSRVLNHEPSVRPITKDRVLKAVEALNFKPSLAARAMSGHKSHQVALLYDNASAYYLFATHEAVRARCDALGVRLILQPLDMRGDAIRQIDAFISETMIDGAILSPPVTESLPLLRRLKRHHLPVVRIAPGTEVAATPSVYMDDVQAAGEVVRHLVGLGHRRIALIAGDRSHISTRYRQAGFEEALREAGIAVDPRFIVEGKYNFHSGFEAGLGLLDSMDRPTAIFASNDDMAAGVLAAAHSRGLSIPEDISVAGFDDFELAQIVWPPLTTIRQPIVEMAGAAADLLMDPRRGTQRKLFQHSLVVRASTGPAPSVS